MPARSSGLLGSDRAATILDDLTSPLASVGIRVVSPFSSAVTTSLHRDRLDHACRRGSWDNARQSETCLIQERFVFFRCSFMPSSDEQHGDICELAGEWRVAGRNDLFDDQKFGGQRRGVRHRAAAVTQNRGGAIIVPVVNDILQYVHIATRRYRLKEISADTCTPIS